MKWEELQKKSLWSDLTLGDWQLGVCVIVMVACPILLLLIFLL